ncbi:hypothetical protein AOQ84DRAFT_362166, partial [Glonium stellatum]
LSGITGRAAVDIDDQYIAGFFRKRLPEDLLWRGEKFNALTEYVGPTWSWAPSSGSAIFSTLGVSVELVDSENPFGQIHHAAMALHGPVFSIIPEGQSNDRHTSPAHAVLPVLATMDLMSDFDLDNSCCLRTSPENLLGFIIRSPTFDMNDFKRGISYELEGILLEIQPSIQGYINETKFGDEGSDILLRPANLIDKNDVLKRQLGSSPLQAAPVCKGLGIFKLEAQLSGPGIRLSEVIAENNLARNLIII